MEGQYVWCGAMASDGQKAYYLYFSHWDASLGMNAWVTHSRIGVAKGASPMGPFDFVGDVLAPSGVEGSFDRDCTHNPAILQWGGKYYLYYMGNYGDASYWRHRNNQRIGVAWADAPAGSFHRSSAPLIDTTPGAHDALMTSNPSVAVGRDGRIIMLYKAVSDRDTLPAGGPVVCAVAFADNPPGPFVKHPKPVMTNDRHAWSVEDPCVWFQDDQYYALVKDFHGTFTHASEGSVALFVSSDGLDWRPDPQHPLAFERVIHWADGTRQSVRNLERPQLYRDESGMLTALLCACHPGDGNLPFNIRIPLAHPAGTAATT